MLWFGGTHPLVSTANCPINIHKEHSIFSLGSIVLSNCIVGIFQVYHTMSLVPTTYIVQSCVH